MDIYTLEDLTLREIKALSVGLKEINIKGVDAMFIGTLQIKIQTQIEQIENELNNPQTANPNPIHPYINDVMAIRVGSKPNALSNPCTGNGQNTSSI